VCQVIHGAGLDAAVGDLLLESITALTLETTLAVQVEVEARAAEADPLRQLGIQTSCMANFALKVELGSPKWSQRRLVCGWSAKAETTLVRLEEQDRRQWDADEIAQGSAILERALRQGRAGPFQIQAAIAACHATAPTMAQTDWPEIVGLYDQLARVAPSGVVDLNRPVAIAMVDGPEAALPLVDAIAETGRLSDYYLLHATRADLQRRAGRTSEAMESFRAALALAPTDVERNFIASQLQRG
jgi:hypothetical protein